MLIKTRIDGCFLMKNYHATDHRGHFRKLFNPAWLNSDFYMHDYFVTTSHANVIRGMHLQLPPFDHYKIVTCLNGHALDCVVDLRSESFSFKSYQVFELSPDTPSILIPPGVAHGFASIQNNTMLSYMTSSIHSPEHDSGIRYDSFGYQWPITSPIISKRDLQLPTAAELLSMHTLT